MPRIDRRIYGLTPEYEARLVALCDQFGYDRVQAYGARKCPLWVLPGGVRKHDHDHVGWLVKCHPSILMRDHGSIWDHVVSLHGHDSSGRPKRGLLVQPYPGAIDTDINRVRETLVDEYDVRVIVLDESPYGPDHADDPIKTFGILIEDPYR
jgi:hypothetical protein